MIDQRNKEGESAGHQNTKLREPDLENHICGPFHSQDVNSYSPDCLPYSSYDASSENLVLDRLIIPQLKNFLYSHHLSA